MPEKIAFGTLLNQGFPFFSGAITYKLKATAKNDSLTVTAADYMGALIEVSVDGEIKGDII